MTHRYARHDRESDMPTRTAAAAEMEEAEPMPARQSQDTELEASTYTREEIAAEAAAFGTNSAAVHGIFREAGKERLTEAEFRDGLARWHGEEGAD